MAIKDIQQILTNLPAGSLGTLSHEGTPFVSLVTVARTGPQQIAMLLSGLAVHTKNLNRNPRGPQSARSLFGQAPFGVDVC